VPFFSFIVGLHQQIVFFIATSTRKMFLMVPAPSLTERQEMQYFILNSLSLMRITSSTQLRKISGKAKNFFDESKYDETSKKKNCFCCLELLTGSPSSKPFFS
jgi:hypothetical protein